MRPQIERLLNRRGTTWSADPAARGAAKLSAGAVLISKGLFRWRRGSWADYTNKGMMNTLAGAFVALLLIGGGYAMKPARYDHEVRTAGTIVDINTSVSKGREMYAGVYSFDAGGRAHRFASSFSSSSRPTVGDKVEVAYLAADPKKAYRTDGLEGGFHWTLLGAGSVLLSVTLTDLVIGLLLTCVGIWLFVRGRADRKAVGATGNFIADLVSFGRASKAGDNADRP